MQGRHPDFTTSRLFVEATDDESGCKWTLHALREKQSSERLPSHGMDRPETYVIQRRMRTISADTSQKR